MLTTLTIALAAGLIVLVPRLEADAQGTGDQPQPALRAAAQVPGRSSGLVEFERTDDVEHLVDRGQTLGAIAQQYGVATAELAEYNGLTNPNQISVGQRIMIPGTLSRRLAREE